MGRMNKQWRAINKEQRPKQAGSTRQKEVLARKKARRLKQRIANLKAVEAAIRLKMEEAFRAGLAAGRSRSDAAEERL